MNRCYLDIDGVLADFTTAALREHGRQIAYHDLTWDFYKKLNLTEEEFWKPLGYEFWYNLPVTEEAEEIVDVVVNYFGESNVVLLTSPCDTKGCIDGKLDWIKKWFPQFRRQCFIGGNKYLVGNKEALLVDDSQDNVDKYRKAGYPAWLVPRPWNNRKYAESLGKISEALKDELRDFELTKNYFFK